MASINTRLNIKNLDGRVHEVHDEKHVWFEVELQGDQRDQRDRKAEVFQVSNDDTVVAQRRAVIRKTEVPGQDGAKDNATERYREDSNEDTFAVAVVEKIYAHESLTFNDTIACEVISKWKAGLKEDMDVRSNVCVLSNGCRKSSDDSHDYYWKYAPVTSQEYQVVCTRPDLASNGVDMLNGFDRGYELMILGCAGSLKANLQHMEALSTSEAGYMSFTEVWKKEIWLKGLLTESGYELRLTAGIATGALVKGCSWSEVLAQVKVAACRY
ncbi:hypothetical protein Tco_0153319 [Tanacetum coccineum]